MILSNDYVNIGTTRAARGVNDLMRHAERYMP